MEGMSPPMSMSRLLMSSGLWIERFETMEASHVAQATQSATHFAPTSSIESRRRIVSQEFAAPL